MWLVQLNDWEGVKGTVSGNRSQSGMQNVPRPFCRSDPLLDRAEALRKRADGDAVAVDGKAAGIVGSRPNQRIDTDAIRELRMQVSRSSWSRDNATTAKAVADKLGIEFYADVLRKRKQR